ncbi:glycogen/starch/alpha-glucan phosphorylase [Fibrobacterota bacterium]
MAKKLSTTTNPQKGKDINSLKHSFINHLEYSCSKDEFSAVPHDYLKCAAMLARDRMVEKWIHTQQTYYSQDAKRVYYLSLEFLMGRALGNSLINLGLYDNTKKALHELGRDLEALLEEEWDAGLGNGGLGRLAACFLDSMATMELPGYGYGIRYDYGMFYQKIVDGYQVEVPDNWLRYGNPWEFERPEYTYPVKFYGRVRQYEFQGTLKSEWIDTEDVLAMAYDTPIPGYRNNTVNNMRLWSAKSTREFDMGFFNHGDYFRAVSDRVGSETISRVLYPNDNNYAGQELRLKQEYFFVSATLQDIIRRYKKDHDTFGAFADKVAVQLNDTHPASAIPELMRLLIDEEGLPWKRAWDLTVATFGYTNHTILSEALERWPVSLFEKLLPRHMQIIYEINRLFLEDVSARYSGEITRLRELSLIEEGGEKKVRMANLAIVGSHSVNGVAALHTEIIKRNVFREFYDLWPDKFNNKTNGITQRRWLCLCNPGLAALISKRIGDRWIKNLEELRRLADYADDEGFQKAWRNIKKKNKQRLAAYVSSRNPAPLDISSLFDCQIKRMHEYKRQLLNVLHVITLYNRLKDGAPGPVVPRTVIFGGKAAPGYHMAKLVIKLINSVAEKVSKDPEASRYLKVIFMHNYCVSLAEKIIPAADLSEQISTAGTEASGTGNMKFALNGALTIGTLDGANIEIRQEVGPENIFIFGMDAGQADILRSSGYNPMKYYRENDSLHRALNMIRDGYFSGGNRNLFKPILDSLLDRGDKYMLLADYAGYIRGQDDAAAAYLDQTRWTRMSILNVAGMGKFSSDRAIKEYAKEIWNVTPVPIQIAPDYKPIRNC